MTISLDNSKEVIWNGAVVGQVYDIRGENWTFYGKWIPRESEEARTFLRILTEGKELIIQIGSGMKGRIDEPPGKEIEWTLCGPA
jgi:hypothetical protein